MRKPARIARLSLGALAVVAAAIQFVPVERTNPPVTGEIPAPAEARAVLRESCYDCHSNETVWPWYSRVAPFSWLVAEDVREAREEMNFSTWTALAPREQAKYLHEILEEVQEGAMPPRLYLLPHPRARLTDDDRAAIRAWTQAAVGEPITRSGD
ncbi:heme-binding domain-containing protein [bacterium]|nr:heme-binding domain-containing protein [bacterium]